MFQCQPSSQQSGQVYIPNIPDFYFDHEQAAALSNGVNLTAAIKGRTYIFTISPESNCTGNVVAIQYCHRANSTLVDNRNRDIFTFLLLSDDGTRFEVEDEFLLQYSIAASVCADTADPSWKVCCNRDILGIQEIFLSSSFTFGVAIRNNVELLTFSNSSTEYRISQLQGMLGNFRGRHNRTNFTHQELKEVNDESLPLVRFFIEENIHGNDRNQNIFNEAQSCALFFCIVSPITERTTPPMSG